MQDIISSLLEFFGVNTIPTDFPSFIYWFCSLVAGLIFVRMILLSTFGMINDVKGASK